MLAKEERLLAVCHCRVLSYGTPAGIEALLIIARRAGVSGLNDICSNVSAGSE